MRTKIALATCMLSASVAAQEVQSSSDDPFSFYEGKEWRPMSTIHATDYVGAFELGLSYVGDDTYTFGKYNGRDEDGVALEASGYYRNWAIESDWVDYLKAEGRDLGLDTRSGSVVLGKLRDYKFEFGFDQQQQVKNFTGQTPFSKQGSEYLALPDGWVAGNNTSEMTAFASTSRRFRQDLERTGYNLGFEKLFGPKWSLNSNFKTEEKTGNMARGAATFANASNGHAVILPLPVDQTTHTLDVGLGYQGDVYNVQASYLFSKFDNDKESITWENPYSAYQGAGVAYPDGLGRLAVDPDNDMHQLRILGNYVFSSDFRISGDASYAKASQDQSFLPYTVNTSLAQHALPRTNLDGEVETTTAKANAFYRFSRNLSFKANYKYEDRDNSSPRNGYLAVTGDAWAPTDEKYRVYNTPHSKTVNRYDFEGTYRLPMSTRVSLMYGYEEVDRYNAAVETTEEDIWKLTVRSRPLQDLTARFEATYKDRGASTYDWSQSYFGLYDPLLISETPDNQRYTNHPLMSQYYVSNREQTQSKLNLSYQVAMNVQLSLDGRYQENDYDETYIGLLEDTNVHATASASWIKSSRFNMSLYLSYDHYEYDQLGRAFNGGIEKNAFEVYDPLPQASDSSRNWLITPEDETQSIGINANWVAIKDQLEFDWDYRYSDTESENNGLESAGASDLTNVAFPDVTSEEHHMVFNSTYHLRDDLSLKFNYQYYRYKGANWAIDGVNPTTVDKLLGTGETSANDQMHMFQISVIYRIQ